MSDDFDKIGSLEKATAECKFFVEKNWEISNRKFDDLIDQLLYNRGVFLDPNDDEAKKNFFEPDFKRDLNNPREMKNLSKALLRIKKAYENDEKIGVYSDYDADGIPGAALMFRALSRIGFKTEIYIPNREKGYGLSKEGIDFLASKKCSLIITVDLGIRNFDEAIYCREVGIDLIVTDHHLPASELPQALYVINPKQKGDKYPYKELCGCGVAYKFVEGLSEIFPDKIDEKFLKWNLDLVAIATIADVVPLNGENRLLSKYGLIVLSKTKNLGILELIKVSGIDIEKINAYHVGFQLAPRINAPGRMDHATKSYEILITEDPLEARELALWLNEKNEVRQSAMDLAEREAINKIQVGNLFENKIIVVAGEWQKGIIGPTASRLVEKYHRPVIMFSSAHDYYTGSARSVLGVNIVNLLEKIKNNIKKFGGHSGAAGLSVERSNFHTFCENILIASDQEITEKDLVKKIQIDAEVILSEINLRLLSKIEKFEPFGMGNPKPIFLANKVSFKNIRFVGKQEQHLSMIIDDGENKIKAISFSFPYNKSMITQNGLYDIVFNVSVDEWQGEKRVNLNVIDLRKSCGV